MLRFVCWSNVKSNLPGPFVHKRPAGTAAPAGQSRRSLTPAGSRASARRCSSRDKGSSSAPVQQAATNYNNAFKKKKLGRLYWSITRPNVMLPSKWLTPSEESPLRSRSLQSRRPSARASEDGLPTTSQNSKVTSIRNVCAHRFNGPDQHRIRNGSSTGCWALCSQQAKRWFSSVSFSLKDLWKMNPELPWPLTSIFDAKKRHVIPMSCSMPFSMLSWVSMKRSK